MLRSLLRLAQLVAAIDFQGLGYLTIFVAAIWLVFSLAQDTTANEEKQKIFSGFSGWTPAFKVEHRLKFRDIDSGNFLGYQPELGALELKRRQVEWTEKSGAKLNGTIMSDPYLTITGKY
jgi:hypothetical protein